MNLTTALRREADLFAQLVLPEPLIGALRLARYDAIINSYPKAGRTWLRLLLVHAFAGHFGLPVDEVKIERMRKHGRHVPHVRAVHGAHGSIYRLAPEQVTLPREVAPFRYSRVVFLARDPRDVIVSLYHHRKNRERDFDGTLWDLAAADEGGFRTILAYMQVWHTARDLPKETLVVRYEDMLADAAGALRRVVDFLGVPASDEVVRGAAEACSFENMRKLEVGGGARATSMRPGAGGSAGLKTRKGKAGGWREEFTAAEAAQLGAWMREGLTDTYGYDPG